MWKDKLGTYLIDISKYVLTGVFIASLFKDMEDMKALVYVLSLLVSLIFLIIGLLFSKSEKKEEGNK